MKSEPSIFDRPVLTPYQELAIPCDWAAFKAVVESRRSVRVFAPRPVAAEDVRECLRLATLAPNSSNLQPWEFYWVRDPAKKARLVEACLGQPSARTASELIVCVSRSLTWRRNRDLMLEFLAAGGGAPKAVENYYRKLVPLAYEQGPLGMLGLFKRAVIYALGFTRAVPREPVSRAQMRLWAVKTTALACENLMLALRARGLDSCPMEGMDSLRVRKLLQLPRDADVVMVVGAGYRAAGGVYGPQIRFDPNLFIKEV